MGVGYVKGESRTGRTTNTKYIFIRFVVIDLKKKKIYTIF